MLSLALALTVIVPITILSLIGWVIDAEGAVVSGQAGVAALADPL
jgi:hypothetical protein